LHKDSNDGGKCQAFCAKVKYVEMRALLSIAEQYNTATTG